MEALGPTLATALRTLRPDVATTVSAHRGANTAQLVAVAQSPASMFGLSPPIDLSLIVAESGTNDFWRPPAQVAEDTARLADLLEALSPGTGTARIFVGPPACPRPDVAQALPGIVEAQQTGLAGRPWGYTDSRPLTSAIPFRSDQVHPTAAGYKTWAAALLDQWQARGRDAAGVAELSAGPRVNVPIVLGVAGLGLLAALPRFLSRY